MRRSWRTLLPDISAADTISANHVENLTDSNVDFDIRKDKPVSHLRQSWRLVPNQSAFNFSRLGQYQNIMTDTNNPSNWDRRSFLKFSTASLAVAAASGASLSSAAAAELLPAKRGGMVNKKSVILFQGDSITDAGRSRDRADVPNLQPGLGNGYAWLAASQLLVDHAGAGLKIYNRGISGNKVFQLAERWDKECIDIQPDVLSILIGVNDIWHALNGNYNGTLETYEKDYRALLARTRKALPKTKIIVCEPFVLRCGAVTDKWFPSFDGYRAAAEKLAKEAKASFVPFQAMFDEAVKYAPAEHWAADGVHPTPAGAALMAHYWLRVVSR